MEKLEKITILEQDNNNLRKTIAKLRANKFINKKSKREIKSDTKSDDSYKDENVCCIPVSSLNEIKSK